MSYRDRDGFYPKYRTIRTDTGEELDPMTTFTLVPERDAHALTAIAVYANSVEVELPQLAADLRRQFGVAP